MSKNVKKSEYSITLKETIYGVVIIFFLIFIFLHGIFNILEFKMLDLRFQLREGLRDVFHNSEYLFKKDKFSNKKIILVGIDDKTREKIKKLPPPRNYYAMVIENLMRFGVKTIGFDMLFETETGDHPEWDDEFSAVLKKYKDHIVLGRKLTDKMVLGQRMVLPENLYRKFDYNTTGVRDGIVNVSVQSDSFVRTMQLFHTIDVVDKNSEIYPSLAMAVVSSYLGLNDKLKDAAIKYEGKPWFKLGPIDIQTGARKSVLINYIGGSFSFTSISFSDVFTISDLEKRIFQTTLDLKNHHLYVEEKARKPVANIEEVKIGKASISGHLSNYENVSGEIKIYAYSPLSKLYGETSVDKNGNFKIEGLKEGYYRISGIHSYKSGGIQRVDSILGVMVYVKKNEETKGVSLWVGSGEKTLEVSIKGNLSDKKKKNIKYRFELDTLSYSAKCDQNGYFKFKNIPSGPVTFSASFMVNEEEDETIDLKEDRIININSSEELPYNIIYSFRDNYIRGEIFGKNGLPVKNAEIIAYYPFADSDPLLKFNVVFLATSDKNGKFKLGKIFSSGYYILSVTINNGKECKNYIERNGIWIKNSDISGEKYSDDEPLENYLKVVKMKFVNGTFMGQIVDEENNPVKDSEVTIDYLKSEGTILVDSKAVNNGKLKISRMLPGSYNFYGEDYLANENLKTSRELKYLPFSFSELEKPQIGATIEDILNVVKNDEYLEGKIKNFSKFKNGSMELTLIDDRGIEVKHIYADEKGKFKFSGISSGKYNIFSKQINKSGKVISRGIASITGIDLKNSIVLIGSLLKTAEDFYPTPFNFDPFNLRENSLDKMYGVEIHANTINMLLNNSGIVRIKKLYNLLLLIVLSFLVMLWMQIHSFKGGLVRVLFILFSFVIVNVLLFIKYNLWVDLWMPLFGIGTVFLFSVSYKYNMEQKKKKKIKSIFERMVPKSVVDECLINDEAAQVNGKKEYLTILFSDIRGFTPMSEALTPEEVVEILNEYMGEMTKIIFNNKGTLDKFIGDAIMVIFGAPIPFEDHPYYAVKCAIEMRDKLNELRKKWCAEGKRMINVGIGVNTGDVVVGNMGSEHRMNYTVIGDHVNLAARLEANTKGGQILISGDTFKHVKDKVIYEKPDPIRVKGKSMLIPIYDILNVKEKVIGKPKEVEE